MESVDSFKKWMYNYFVKTLLSNEEFKKQTNKQPHKQKQTRKQKQELLIPSLKKSIVCFISSNILFWEQMAKVGAILYELPVVSKANTYMYIHFQWPDLIGQVIRVVLVRCSKFLLAVVLCSGRSFSQE